MNEVHNFGSFTFLSKNITTALTPRFTIITKLNYEQNSDYISNRIIENLFRSMDL